MVRMSLHWVKLSDLMRRMPFQRASTKEEGARRERHYWPLTTAH